MNIVLRKNDSFELNILMNNSRRKFLKKSSLITLAGLGVQLFSNKILSAMGTTRDGLAGEPFTLPKLPYEFDSLEPFMDAMTMEIHYTKHHRAYVDNLNKAVAAGKISSSLDEIIKSVSSFPPVIRNNAGGHWNHSFFWRLMKPEGGGSPDGKIEELINDSFGSFETFKTQFEDAGLKRFGSGWAWLVIDANKKLVIGSTPNQDNPLMDVSELKGIPILAVDVWEHAYYLKFQNKRGEYLKSWWNVVNWTEVNKNFEKAMK